MRVFLTAINNYRICKDRSPEGTPRFVVEPLMPDEDMSTWTFSGVWYKQKQVEEIVESWKY
tara:strand:- start:92 stop:274 length:183 start_codon:yes stop_codon:yes gene_type:complete